MPLSIDTTWEAYPGPKADWEAGQMATGTPDYRPAVERVRALALTLPRTTEKLVRDRVTFRVGAIVYCGFSQDETVMGFGFPKDHRAALVAADDRYLMPTGGDLRWNWVLCHPDRLEPDELADRVVDAWRMVVPTSVAATR